MANKILGLIDGQKQTEFTLDISGLFYVFHKKGQAAWYVLAQDANQTDQQIASTPGIPQVGTLFNGVMVQSNDARELMTVIHPTTHVTTILWEVTITADSHLNTNNATTGSPTDMRPKRRWYTEKENRVQEKDCEGTPIVTAANEPIITEWPEVIRVLEITRYELYPFDPRIIDEYVETSNENYFYLAPPGTALIDSIEADEEIVNNETFIKARYVIKFRIRRATLDPDFIYLTTTTTTPDPNNPIGLELDTYHFVKLLNNGYLYRKEANAIPVTYIDKNGQPIKVNLETDGTLLDEDRAPVYLPYCRAPKIDWSPLNLEFFLQPTTTTGPATTT